MEKFLDKICIGIEIPKSVLNVIFLMYKIMRQPANQNYCKIYNNFAEDIEKLDWNFTKCRLKIHTMSISL